MLNDHTYASWHQHLTCSLFRSLGVHGFYQVWSGDRFVVAEQEEIRGKYKESRKSSCCLWSLWCLNMAHTFSQWFSVRGNSFAYISLWCLGKWNKNGTGFEWNCRREDVLLHVSRGFSNKLWCVIRGGVSQDLVVRGTRDFVVISFVLLFGDSRWSKKEGAEHSSKILDHLSCSMTNFIVYIIGLYRSFSCNDCAAMLPLFKSITNWWFQGHDDALNLKAPV